MATNKKKIMVYVTDYEYEQISNLAKEKGVSMSRILSGSVYAYLMWRSGKMLDCDYTFRRGSWTRKGLINSDVIK